MDFNTPPVYQPARLGIPRPASARPDRDDGHDRPRRPSYEAWREILDGRTEETTPRPEAEVLADLRRQGEGKGLKLILGEPGGGKTRLLEEWTRRWEGENQTLLHLGLEVPVLVKLRQVAPEVWLLSGSQLADALWGKRPYPRLLSPCWLLDGLDEIRTPEGLAWGDVLEHLAALPGVRIATCRSAVFQGKRREGNPHVSGPEMTLLPLDKSERLAFLTSRLGNAADAEGLETALAATPPLAPLAGNPLLLDLAALVWSEDRHVLPGSRAIFYQRGIALMWTRRMETRPQWQTLRGYRDPVLAALARRMGLRDVEAPLSQLDEALAEAKAPLETADALRHSGLLAQDDLREVVSFYHLTVQEYALAQSLRVEGMQQALNAHWHDPRYEEALALLLGWLVKDGKSAEAGTALATLIAYGRKTIQTNPEELFEKERSPLRTALHLLWRAGVDPGEVGLEEMLKEEIGRGSLRKETLGEDTHTPPAVLRWLAGDGNEEVRKRVARNTTTPPDILRRLAEDPEKWVRRGVAGNTATPSDILRRLAEDPEKRVRWGVAENTAIPPDILRRLAEDPEMWVRSVVAENTATPPDILRRLAEDPEERVREGVVNTATPPDILRHLAEDPEKRVRWSVAENTSTPPDILRRLAEDPEKWVRRGVAGNTATPSDILRRLAEDPEKRVRWGVAENTAIPPDILRSYILRSFGEDPNQEVRSVVAENTATPPDILRRLAEDPDQEVRRSVAWNTATPSDILRSLGEDPDLEVRLGVAWNTATPPDTLRRLAEDPEKEVRLYVAGNTATLLEFIPKED